MADLPEMKSPGYRLSIERQLKLGRADDTVTAMAHNKLPGLTATERAEVVVVAGADAPLFDPDTLELDGWRRVQLRWVPPDSHAIDENPIRGKGLLRPASGSTSRASGGSPAVQKLAQLTPVQFRREYSAIEDEELRKRWASDPETWLHRWDRRAEVDRQVGRTARQVQRQRTFWVTDCRPAANVLSNRPDRPKGGGWGSDPSDRS